MRSALIALLVLVLAAIAVGGNYYVVSGKGQTALIPKDHFALTPIFVNFDNWSVVDLVSNRDIALATIRAGKGGMLPGGGVIDAVNAIGKAGAAVVDEVAGEAAKVVSGGGAQAEQDVTGKLGPAIESHPEAQQVGHQGRDAAGASAASARAAAESRKAAEQGKAMLNQWGRKLHDAIRKGP